MNFRKITAVFVCVILSLSLVACGKGGDKDSDKGNNLGGGATYTVKFDVGDEARAAGISNPADVTVAAGGTITLPTVDWADHIVVWKNGESVFTASTVVTGNITLVGSWSIITQYDKDINSGAATWAQSGHLYIHYNRGHDASENGKTNSATGPDYTASAIDSATYGDWGVWAWPRGNANGKLFNAARIDETGAVYDILIDNDYDHAGWNGNDKTYLNATINYKTGDDGQVGFQIHSIKSRTEGEGFWINDGGDNFIAVDDSIKRPNGSYHWYVSTNEVTNGTAYYMGGEIFDPYKGFEAGSQTTKYSGDKTVNSSGTSEYQGGLVATDMDDTAVGYQIFIASFCDSDGDGKGDIQGIIQKLGYLKDLNVDILWLTPFQNSIGYHGYDITDYYSVDPKFGTLADYRELVYKAHEKGMKIVMDFVLNHTALANPWFQKSSNLVVEGEGANKIEYRHFYNWINETQYSQIDCPTTCPAHSNSKKKHTCDRSHWFKDNHGYYFYSSFGSSMPELNYDYQPVRDAIVDVAKYWMEFGLDGFRLDAVKHIYMRNEVQGSGRGTSGDNIVSDNDHRFDQDVTRNINFYREFNYKLKSVYPNAFVVGENLTGDPAGLAPYYEGIDSQFNFNLYYDVTRAIVSSSGIPQGGTDTLASAYSAYNKGLTGEGYPGFGGYKSVNSNFIDGPFTSNHDLPRARDRMNITKIQTGLNGYDKPGTFFKNNKVDGTEADLDGNKWKTTEDLLRMYYAFQFMLPGVTWIYNGDEIGMSGLMQFTADSATASTSSTDSSAHEDKVYRQPMKWFTEIDKNGKFDIGYGDLECKLEGLNATSKVASVEAQLEDKNSILSWVKTLTSIRDKKGLAKSTVTVNNGNGGNDINLKIQGSKGAVNLKMTMGGTQNMTKPSTYEAYWSGTINGKTATVIITAA